VANYKKKRAKELKHDRFRDTTMSVVDRLGDKLEGKGRTILYAIVGVIVLAALVGLGMRWQNRKADEARQALGRAITIATTPLATPEATPSTEPTFATERERAQRAVEEFQKVAAKYGDPYHSEARYFAATNMLSYDRAKGISELTELSKGSVPDVATLAKFALAQAKEADKSYDEAAQLYKEIAAQNSAIVTADTANLRLALTNEKQGKKQEATETLFNIVENARKAKDPEGNPAPMSAAAREAATELQRIDSARYAQLTPEAPRTDLPF
jgi:tetratricopeptide (TPR) repeat protein